jgi:hypothetical protein
MKLNFRLDAPLFFALALAWMFAPNFVLSSWGVAYLIPCGVVEPARGSSVRGNSLSCSFRQQTLGRRLLAQLWLPVLSSPA